MADSSEGEGSSSGMERWPGVDLEDVNELTREYRRKTQVRSLSEGGGIVCTWSTSTCAVDNIKNLGKFRGEDESWMNSYD